MTEALGKTKVVQFILWKEKWVSCATLQVCLWPYKERICVDAGASEPSEARLCEGRFYGREGGKRRARARLQYNCVAVYKTASLKRLGQVESACSRTCCFTKSLVNQNFKSHVWEVEAAQLLKDDRWC